ncbi:hypothetical protein [Paenibacillus puerhi]|uniref:hypothetical protein n=1 Tax=Paenibacillus puerhi TaxID=2692622 RepID=UPI00135C49AC|nr:hypothetical protein [Paenibacillus puerhi]
MCECGKAKAQILKEDKEILEEIAQVVRVPETVATPQMLVEYIRELLMNQVEKRD